MFEFEKEDELDEDEDEDEEEDEGVLEESCSLKFLTSRLSLASSLGVSSPLKFPSEFLNELPVRPAAVRAAASELAPFDPFCCCNRACTAASMLLLLLEDDEDEPPDEIDDVEDDGDDGELLLLFPLLFI